MHRFEVLALVLLQILPTTCLEEREKRFILADTSSSTGSTELWRVSSVRKVHSFDELLAPFKPLHRAWGDDSLSYSTDHSERPALKVHYAKGSYSKTSHRGGGFYSTPPEVPDGVDRLILMYDVYFSNFGFGRMGKLPGLFGGQKGSGAYACSGGNYQSSCFSLRLMWRENGQGELYAYIPHSQENGFAQRDDVIYHERYGQSIGRGKIYFKNEKWQTVMILAVLNTPGKADGYVKFCNTVEGETKQCYTAHNLVIRDKAHPDHHLRGLFFSTFFGGSNPEDAAPNECSTYFKNFRLKFPSGYTIG